MAHLLPMQFLLTCQSLSHTKYEAIEDQKTVRKSTEDVLPIFDISYTFVKLAAARMAAP